MLEALTTGPVLALLPRVLAQEGLGPVVEAPPEPTAATGAVSLLDYIQAGGIVSYLLIIISVVALALVVRNMLALRLRVIAPPETVAGLDGLLAAGRLDEAGEFCANAEPSSFLSRVLGQAFQRCSASQFGFLEFRGAVEEAAQAESDELHRLNDGLGIIAAIGPMLGLLGTVFGMIGAFRSIGALEGAARSSQLSLFMSMALVNTAQGLIVAVPCTIAFALFRRHIDRLLMRVGAELERVTQAVAMGASALPSAASPQTGPMRQAAVGPYTPPAAPARSVRA